MHRDLKPENFLFDTPDEDAKLKATDFGLSVFYKPGQYLSDVVGSPYYVAPEVLHKFYGPEADVWSAGVILYILLCGVPPFWADTDNGIFRQILNGKLDLDSEPWPHISDSAKDLVQKMLDRNPKRRLSAHQVLCHSRKTFRRRDRWIETVVQNDRYRQQRCKTFDELKQGLKRVGSELTESEIKALMEAADVDNNGTIDYGEFLAATLHMNKIEREENLAAAFSFFDKDGSGYITIDELQQACKDFGIAEAHLDDMIKEADTDNDGRIDYGEFAAMMREGNPALASRTQRGNLNFNLADALQGRGSPFTLSFLHAKTLSPSKSDPLSLSRTSLSSFSNSLSSWSRSTHTKNPHCKIYSYRGSSFIDRARNWKASEPVLSTWRWSPNERKLSRL
ncbi:UNVERIFIED_CONTAM: Calcium-dependent protein kinase SK5 [Sesamum latifolium]|uniref:Calcium-dependent protein kinase SK5 n=1 Tax=Sesamum latifolium TaxID=2727402 RepID=A0AAW2VRZ0_9LAMI